MCIRRSFRLPHSFKLGQTFSGVAGDACGVCTPHTFLEQPIREIVHHIERHVFAESSGFSGIVGFFGGNKVVPQDLLRRPVKP